MGCGSSDMAPSEEAAGQGGSEPAPPDVVDRDFEIPPSLPAGAEISQGGEAARLEDGFPKPDAMSDADYQQLKRDIAEAVGQNWTTKGKQVPEERLQGLYKQLQDHFANAGSGKMVAGVGKEFIQAALAATDDGEPAFEKAASFEQEGSMHKAAKSAAELLPGGPSSAHSMTVIFVLGGPGSGKGTQCARIVEDFQFVHLSVGELLRREVRSGSPLAAHLEQTMKEGELVDTETTLTLLRTAMDKSKNKRFLIDGFPRAVDQAKAFAKLIGSPDLVLFFDCPLRVMQDRLSRRETTRVRNDDSLGTIRKRFLTYTNQTLPVIGFYEEHCGDRVATFSGEPDYDAVYLEVNRLLQQRRSLFVPLPNVQPAEVACDASSDEGWHGPLRKTVNTSRHKVAS